MKKYTAKTFDIPELKGISAKNIEEHLKLYEGYVKHTNLILEKIAELGGSEENAYAVAEMQRRFGFEFDGMRNHEYYFSSLEGGSKPIDESNNLHKAITEEWGSFDSWLNRFKTLAKTRGIGWAILYFDKKEGKLLNSWVDEQHLGHLTGLSPILALDMWEHSFVSDYQPSGRGQYIEDFFENLNWNVIKDNFEKAQ
ncbi:superoxide dismutase [Candidatus Nomurabacteria bacterium]|nr:superoxide dismutase [Candidatus Nomurabacteria bacterium]